MKISIRYSKPAKFTVTGLEKGSVSFANMQFKSLVKKNLGLPMKIFNL